MLQKKTPVGDDINKAQACAACGVLTACAVAAGGNRRRLNIQARQLVLTCAYFDQSGRIMVTPHALLPSRKIVDRYIGKVCSRARISGHVLIRDPHATLDIQR